MTWERAAGWLAQRIWWNIGRQMHRVPLNSQIVKSPITHGPLTGTHLLTSVATRCHNNSPCGQTSEETSDPIHDADVIHENMRDDIARRRESNYHRRRRRNSDGTKEFLRFIRNHVKNYGSVSSTLILHVSKMCTTTSRNTKSKSRLSRWMINRKFWSGFFLQGQRIRLLTSPAGSWKSAHLTTKLFVKSSLTIS